MKLDYRDKLTLEDGSTCVFMKHSAKWDYLRLCTFDLYDSPGALSIKCRIKGTFFRRLVFSDAHGRELATIQFKWSLPILCLPGGEEIELNFFRHLGTDLLPEASVELFGSTIYYAGGVFSVNDGEMSADKQGLLKAALCFCRLYPIARQRVMEELWDGFRALIIAWAVAIFVYNLYTH